MTYMSPIMSTNTVNVNNLIGGSVVQWVAHWTSKCEWYKCTNWGSEIDKFKFKNHDLIYTVIKTFPSSIMI